MSEPQQLTAINLVLEYLESKKFDAAAAALRNELEAVQTQQDASEGSKVVVNPVERGFTQLEALLARTRVTETTGSKTGSLDVSTSISSPPKVNRESSLSLPTWYVPADELEEDEWTDDEALGYTKHPYTEETLLATNSSSRSTPMRSRRHNPAVSKKGHASGHARHEEDEEDLCGGGVCTGEEGDDESEIASDPVPRTNASHCEEQVALLSLEAREPLFEIYPNCAMLEPSSSLPLAPMGSVGAGEAVDATSRPFSGAPTPSRSAVPLGSDKVAGTGSTRVGGPTARVAVSLAAALDSGAEADADTEGGAVSTEDEAGSLRDGVGSNQSLLGVVGGSGADGKAPESPRPITERATEEDAESEGQSVALVEAEEEEELGEEELGEEDWDEEESSEMEGDEESRKRAASKAEVRKASETAAEAADDAESDDEEDEEIILESDPDIDPLERARAEEGKYETMQLKVIHERGRTGFEEHKDFQIRLHSLIAARYQIKEYLGSAAFSKAVQCLDLHTGEMVCIKIIKNNKDFFDQSLDEIKLLAYLKHHDEADEHNIVHMLDFFYHKEHLFIVCELLRDNLYEFSRYNRESGGDPYFTLPRLRRIAKQCLDALVFTHKLNLIHCDLKPENILIKSYSRCEVKVIDFGSSCFSTDHLSSYVQSRSYRAPEVILGLPYDEKIDLWSLGAILAELLTGYVLFQNDSVASMLARISGILGPFPPEMLLRGRHASKYFVQGVVFERDANGKYHLLRPKITSLRQRLHTNDEQFLSFVGSLLRIDPKTRPTAAQALQHPWIATDPYGWPPSEESHGASSGKPA